MTATLPITYHIVKACLVEQMRLSAFHGERNDLPRWPFAVPTDLLQMNSCNFAYPLHPYPIQPMQSFSTPYIVLRQRLVKRQSDCAKRGFEEP